MEILPIGHKQRQPGDKKGDVPFEKIGQKSHRSPGVCPANLGPL